MDQVGELSPPGGSFPLTQAGEAALVNRPALPAPQNAVQNLAGNYLPHMDTLVIVIIDKLNQVNQVQLYLLAVNGVACGLIGAATAWVMYQRLLKFRLAVYGTFLVVPMAWLRTLAVSPPFHCSVGQRLCFPASMHTRHAPCPLLCLHAGQYSEAE